MFRKLTMIVIVSFIAINAIFLTGVSLLSYKIFFQFTSNEISQTRLALLNENTEKISSFISTISDVGLYIAANRSVSDIFAEKPVSTYDAIQEQRSLTELSNHVSSLKNPIHSIEIYTDRFVGYPTISNSSVYPLEQIEKEPWMNVFEKMDSGWVPKHMSLHHNIEMISYIHRLNSPRGKSVGYVKVNVVANTFFEKMGVDDLYEAVNEPLVLLNAGGRIITQKSSPQYKGIIDEITEPLSSEPFSILVDSYYNVTNKHQILTYGNEMFLLLISKPNNDSWQMVQLIPVANLYAKTKQLGYIVLLLGFCGLLLSIPFAFWIGKRIMKPIGEIIQGMRHVEKGNFEVKIGPYYIEEYNLLSENFNHMTAKLLESHNRLNEEHHYRREAELKALQSQINPHFLYNTLDMIHWKAMDHQAKEISFMVNQLSRMLRIGLSGGQKFIPLRDELEHVKCYINIQNARLPNPIRFDLKIPASLKDFYIPKIIIQPFIENSIRHGYLEEEMPVQIKITACSSKEMENEMLEISIFDNGIGLPAEFSIYSGKGIGIKNVQERIWLYCGKQYGIKLVNQKEGGVKVHITLPIIKSEKERNEWDENETISKEREGKERLQ
ncbi:sensor histidine kinase [Metabacillus niabensis]|uniref:histidine kinase n=1 Tax=Metabacillus niabensis TaxID=324854 RepID=A0ABT9Z5U0_9BACI|nr:sensor histidine kinase [Metabacillus niabensis]MDQ0227385.1 sensor histidine kinase YesM [Metabacillus niabensis]